MSGVILWKGFPAKTNILKYISFSFFQFLKFIFFQSEVNLLSTKSMFSIPFEITTQTRVFRFRAGESVLELIASIEFM